MTIKRPFTVISNPARENTPAADSAPEIKAVIVLGDDFGINNHYVRSMLPIQDLTSLDEWKQRFPKSHGFLLKPMTVSSQQELDHVETAFKEMWGEKAAQHVWYFNGTYMLKEGQLHVITNKKKIGLLPALGELPEVKTASVLAMTTPVLAKQLKDPNHPRLF